MAYHPPKEPGVGVAGPWIQRLPLEVPQVVLSGFPVGNRLLSREVCVGLLRASGERLLIGRAEFLAERRPEGLGLPAVLGRSRAVDTLSEVLDSTW